MYIYKQEDYISNNIIKEKSWESKDTKMLIDALNYYSSLKNIKNDDIFILDIGGNIGWHSIFLGKYGYQILSFEPSDINNYILKKNYCLNPGLNVIFIKKGLFIEDKKCDYYMLRGNIGNGMILCSANITAPFEFIKRGKTYMTKLSNYIEFLSTKNLALIKIDIEGSEGKAIESGIELITNYHVPFIFLEFTPNSLRIHGTDPMKFLEMFEKNGYKFPKDNFFDNKYYKKEELIRMGLINIYIVYSNIIKNEEK
jgi:FkbM family methyltransferase